MNTTALKRILGLFIVVLGFVFFGSLFYQSGLSVPVVLLGHPPALEWMLFTELRLPRVLSAGSIGALLGLAGVAIQARFRNPLAEPNLIGVNGGAALAAGWALSLGAGMALVSLSAFLGGVVALFLLWFLARAPAVGSQLILCGVALSTLLSSSLMLLITTLPDGTLRSVTFWLMGSLAGMNWLQTQLLLWAVPVVWILLWAQWKFLNALQLGETTAFYLGFQVARRAWGVVVLAAFAAGLVVANCGMIGFIGLMAPHLARQCVGGNTRRLLIFAPLVGAILMITSDWIARTVLAPAELPVGVITSLIGAPFFLWLLRQRAGASHA